MRPKGILPVVMALLALAVCFAAAQSAEEDHKPSIRGIGVGAKTQDVLDHLGRMPDTRKDEKEEVIVRWKLEDGNLLQVNLRGDNVSQVALQYKQPRPSTDLWLQPLSTPASRSDLTVSDPRLRRDYKATETMDKLRTVWTRQEKMPDGYRVEIRFLSGSRSQFGNRFEEYVEFKYVMLFRDDLKKFDQAMQATQRP